MFPFSPCDLSFTTRCQTNKAWSERQISEDRKSRASRGLIRRVVWGRGRVMVGVAGGFWGHSGKGRSRRSPSNTQTHAPHQLWRDTVVVGGGWTIGWVGKASPNNPSPHFSSKRLSQASFRREIVQEIIRRKKKITKNQIISEKLSYKNLVVLSFWWESYADKDGPLNLLWRRGAGWARRSAMISKWTKLTQIPTWGCSKPSAWGWSPPSRCQGRWSPWRACPAAWWTGPPPGSGSTASPGGGGQLPPTFWPTRSSGFAGGSGESFS